MSGGLYPGAMSILVIKDSDSTTCLLEGSKLVLLDSATVAERMGTLRLSDAAWTDLVTAYGPIVS